jgi:hypothetical protein
MKKKKDGSEDEQDRWQVFRIGGRRSRMGCRTSRIDGRSSRRNSLYTLC